MLLLVLTFASCTLVSDPRITVSVDLPALPEVWQPAFPDMTYRVFWSGPRGFTTFLPGVYAPGTSASVSLPRTPPIAVLAIPVSGTRSFAPAGALWPLQIASDGAIPLRFAEGPAADLLMRAAAQGADMERFAVARLASTIREELPHDPWQLDVTHVARMIADGRMRESYVRAAERYPVRFPPPAGTWYAYSPFQAPVTAERGWPPLATGVHRFSGGDGRRIYVEMDEEGRATVLGP